MKKIFILINIFNLMFLIGCGKNTDKPKPNKITQQQNTEKLKKKIEKPKQSEAITIAQQFYQAMLIDDIETAATYMINGEELMDAFFVLGRENEFFSREKTKERLKQQTLKKLKEEIDPTKQYKEKLIEVSLDNETYIIEKKNYSDNNSVKEKGTRIINNQGAIKLDLSSPTEKEDFLMMQEKTNKIKTREKRMQSFMQQFLKESYLVDDNVFGFSLGSERENIIKELKEKNISFKELGNIYSNEYVTGDFIETDESLDQNKIINKVKLIFIDDYLYSIKLTIQTSTDIDKEKLYYDILTKIEQKYQWTGQGKMYATDTYDKVRKSAYHDYLVDTLGYQKGSTLIYVRANDKSDNYNMTIEYTHKDLAEIQKHFKQKVTELITEEKKEEAFKAVNNASF